MNKTFKTLERQQLLKKLNASLSFSPTCVRPPQGWVHTARKALGMTMAQLARRLGVQQSRVAEIEKTEVHDQLTLKTLRAVASALGCRLEYVFIPEKPIESLLQEEALKRARTKIKYVSHHMALENQSLSSDEKEAQIQALAAELLKTPHKLWDES